MTKCSTCNSPRPHLHPAVQFEGEVNICTDDFHLQPDNQRRPQWDALVLQERARATA